MKKNFFRRIYQRKKILGISLSIFIFFTFIFSIITTFTIKEYIDINNSPIDPEIASRNINWWDYYDKGIIEKHVDQYRKYIKNNSELKDIDFDEYKVPSESVIEIEITEAYDFNEQTSSIYAKGFITAKWDENAVQNYREKNTNLTLHKKTRDDILSTTYLNFYDSENQIYRKFFLDNVSKKKISKYEFSGRFRVERDLSKFPFEELTFEVGLSSLMDARDINFINTYHDSFTDDKYRFEAFINKMKICYEYDDTNIDQEPQYSCNYNELRPNFYSEIDHYGLDELETDNISEDLWKYGFVPYINNEVNFQRAYTSSFFRYILPLIVGITVLFLTNYLPDKFRDFKLATPPTVLLTFIFMQNGYQAEIPQISYITFIDKLYYLSYLSAILQLSNTLLSINSRNKFVRKIEKVFNIKVSTIFRLTFLFITIFVPLILYATS